MLIRIVVNNFFLAEIPILYRTDEIQGSVIISVSARHIVGIQQMMILFLLSQLKVLGAEGIFSRGDVYVDKQQIFFYAATVFSEADCSLLCNPIITYLQTQQMARSFWPSLRQTILLESLLSSSYLANVVSGVCGNPATIIVRSSTFPLHSGT